MDAKDEKLQAITDKLGIDPRTWKPELPPEGWTEDVPFDNPFEKLTLEELNYLNSSGFLDIKPKE